MSKTISNSRLQPLFAALTKSFGRDSAKDLSAHEVISYIDAFFDLMIHHDDFQKKLANKSDFFERYALLRDQLFDDVVEPVMTQLNKKHQRDVMQSLTRHLVEIDDHDGVSRLTRLAEHHGLTSNRFFLDMGRFCFDHKSPNCLKFWGQRDHRLRQNRAELAELVSTLIKTLCSWEQGEERAREFAAATFQCFDQNLLLAKVLPQIDGEAFVDAGRYSFAVEEDWVERELTAMVNVLMFLNEHARNDPEIPKKISRYVGTVLTWDENIWMDETDERRQHLRQHVQSLMPLACPKEALRVMRKALGQCIKNSPEPFEMLYACGDQHQQKQMQKIFKEHHYDELRQNSLILRAIEDERVLTKTVRGARAGSTIKKQSSRRM